MSDASRSDILTKCFFRSCWVRPGAADSDSEDAGLETLQRDVFAFFLGEKEHSDFGDAGLETMQ